MPYGESDLVATFFTETTGKLTAIVRGARRSTKRFGGALEPIHELAVSLEDKGKELCLLKEARIARARTGVASSLEAMEAGGQGLRWIRHLCPPRTPEPPAWRSIGELLDALDAGGSQVTLTEARQHLAVFGLRLLADMGYALELERCIRCGRPCPPERPAFLDASAGGIVCTSCGGARRTISQRVRVLAAAAQRGESVLLALPDSGELVDIIDEAMAAHAGFDRHTH